MGSVYEHINSRTEEVIHGSKQDRTMFLNEELFIPYPMTKKLFTYLEQMMERPKKIRPQNLLLIGEPHMGKTSIVTKFVQEHETYTAEDESGMSIVIRPVVLALAKEKPSLKELYISILEGFWTPFNPGDSEVKLRHQTLHLMQKCNVKMLIIDEIHHFLRGSAINQRNVMDALKNIGTQLMIPIVGVGLKEAVMILTADPQLSSRFDVVTLDKWELDKEFRMLLKSFEKRLPLKKPSHLDAQDKATLLHLISRGNLGNLHRIIRDCAEYAIEHDIEEITLEMIQKFKNTIPTDALTPRELRL